MIEENSGVHCACPSCPLYNACNEYEKDKEFCTQGPSQCEMDTKKECICESCLIYQQNLLEGKYFCSK